MNASRIQLLYELFSRGRLAAHGVVVNLDRFRSAPIDVEAVWVCRRQVVRSRAEARRGEDGLMRVDCPPNILKNETILLSCEI